MRRIKPKFKLTGIPVFHTLISMEIKLDYEE
jgi:hypothetical protein